MRKVAVIILNWNGERLLREFLPSVVRRTNPELGRVVVVDNCSTDGSWACLENEFPEVKRVAFEKNFGFAGGYNRAIGLVKEEYVVLLNSDVEVAEGWLEPLVEALEENGELVAVQPKVLAYKDRKRFEYAGACGGYIDWLGFPFCRGRIMDHTEEDVGQYDKPAEVFWATGAALCVRREAYLRAGGLDEAFFAHMEEIDLCWRLKNNGWKLAVVPSSQVWHLGGGSLPMNHPKKLFLNYRNNLLMLYKNLERKTGKRVLFVRFWLDCLAMAVFFVKGEFANAKSVCRAYRDYFKMKKNYTPAADCHQLSGVYKGSIIVAYFLRGRKKFSQIRF